MHLTCVTFDTADPGRVARFWAEALGWQATVGEHGAICARPGVNDVYLEFVTVPESKRVKNRVHLGNETADLDAEIGRLSSLGATFLYEEDIDEPGYRNVVMADPEGNEFCLGWNAG